MSGGSDNAGDGDAVSQKGSSIPLNLKLVLYAELIFYSLTFFRSYLSSFRTKWHAMSKTEMGLTELWRGDMRKGMVAFIAMYLIGNTLLEGVVDMQLVETLLIVHALGMGVYIGTVGPCPWPLLDLTLNAHTWLSVGVLVTGWPFARWWCTYLCAVFVLYGVYMNQCQFSRHIYGDGNWTHGSYRRAIVEALRVGRTYHIAEVPAGGDQVGGRYVCVKDSGDVATRDTPSRDARCRSAARFTLEYQGNSPQGNHLYHIRAPGGRWFFLRPNGTVATTDKIRSACIFELVHQIDQSYFIKAETGGRDLWIRVDERQSVAATERSGEACLFSFEHFEERLGFRLPDMGFDRLRIAMNILDWLGYQEAPVAPAEESEPLSCCSNPCGVMFRLIMFLLIVLGVKISSWHPNGGFEGGELGECDKDSGGRCNALEQVFPTLAGCASWRNASCERGKNHWRGRCVCHPEGTCAYGGMCLWNPALLTYSGAKAPSGPPHEKSAIVLSGGGAKGAWEVGVLEGICSNESLAGLRGWTMLVGTSIGALNAGFLAQFAPSRQCSEAVPALAAFWSSIQDLDDIVESPSTPYSGHDKCFALLQGAAMLLSFATHGGICMPKPGAERFEFSVDGARIRSSGMQLRMLATSLGTGGEKWWDEASDDVIAGSEASGSIAPLVTPKEVAGEWYIDGGLLHNTPLCKALEDGATTVLVMIVDPLVGPDGVNVSKLGADHNIFGVGGAIAEFELNLFFQRYFVDSELSAACDNYPHAKIWGYVPTADVGSLIDFDRAQINEMRRKGRLATMQEPIDLCMLSRGRRRKSSRRPPSEALGLSAQPVAPPTLILVGVAGAAYLAGASHSFMRRRSRSRRGRSIEGAESLLPRGGLGA